MKLLTNVSLPTSSNAFKRINMLFDEQIIKLGSDEIIPPDDTEVIDAKGLILLPGGVDPHVHLLRESTTSYQDISSATKAALQGGWTTMAELSYHTEHPLYKPADLQDKAALIDDNSFIDMALWGHVDITDYPYHAEAARELWEKGVVGIAICAPTPNPAIAEISFTEIMDLFMDIYESDTSFAFQGYDHENHSAYSFTAQRDAIKKLLRRMQENPIHIPRVASFPTMEFINSISKRSDISYALCLAEFMHLYNPEVFPASLACNFADYPEQLFELLRTNKIYLFSNSTSNHATKQAANDIFAGNDPHYLSYSYLWVLSELNCKRKIPLSTCIKMTSENAAKRLGLYPRKGCIAKGADADFVLYDQNSPSCYQAKASASPPLEFTGSFKAVYLRGEQVAGQDFKTKRMGRFLPRQTNPKRRYNNTSWV